MQVDQTEANSCEITVQYSERSKPVGTLSFLSDDHEHGSCLGEAAWTSDSRYFVFSILSSGGHQPWHAPIMVYFREKNLTKPLESFLDNPANEAIADPHFVLSSDHIEFATTGLGPTFERDSLNHRSIDLQSLQP